MYVYSVSAFKHEIYHNLAPVVCFATVPAFYCHISSTFGEDKILERVGWNPGLRWPFSSQGQFLWPTEETFLSVELPKKREFKCYVMLKRRKYFVFYRFYYIRGTSRRAYCNTIKCHFSTFRVQS